MAKYPYTNTIASSERLTIHADLIHERFEVIGYVPFLRWLIDTVPESLLDILAKEFSLTIYEGWGMATSPEKKREMLKASVALHRSKGTPASIRRILKILGFGEVQIITHLHTLKHNGKGKRDGTYFHGDKKKWAFYRVKFLERPVTNSQASIIKEVLKSFAPAHEVLLSLDYAQVAITHNGQAKRNGEYNYGKISGS